MALEREIIKLDGAEELARAFRGLEQKIGHRLGNGAHLRGEDRRVKRTHP